MSEEIKGTPSVINRTSPDAAVAAIDAMFTDAPTDVAPVAEVTDKPQQEVPAEEAKAPEAVKETLPETKEEPEVLDLEKYRGKKVRVKIGGVESVAPFEDVVKKYQLDGYLTQQAQKLADDRRKFEHDRRSQISRTPAPADSEASTQNVEPSNDPRAALKAELLEELRAEIAPIRQAVEPVAIQTERKRVADELKAEGFQDAESFDKKIEAHLGSITDPAELEQTLASGGFGASIRHEIEPVRVSTSASISLGIIITEWVTNAFKYAYAGQTGEVRVLARKLDDKLLVTVEDDGVGMSTGAPTRGTGVGSKIVTTIARSLKAEVAYLSRNPGTEARLVMSLEPA